MTAKNDRHHSHLAEIPDDLVKRKLAFFRLPDVELVRLPFICTDFIVRAPFKEFNRWVHPLDPVSLDDLKNWFGVPNEVALKLHQTRRIPFKGWNTIDRGSLINPRRARKPAPQPTLAVPRDLPTEKNWKFRSLDGKRKMAVQQMSRNLLHGYVSSEILDEPIIQNVVKHMLRLARMKDIKIFLAPDLIVCPDDVVEFHNLPALYFNNILIYGNGQIRIPSNTTIHAQQIKHVA